MIQKIRQTSKVFTKTTISSLTKLKYTCQASEFGKYAHLYRVAPFNVDLT